jgi:hypothetical protein
MTKVRPASGRQVRAFHLRTQLEMSVKLACELRPEDLHEYGLVAIPLDLVEEIRQYLSEDEPKFWRLPGVRQGYKDFLKEEEAKLTLDELAKARNIQVASAERRIKRQRK